MIIVKGPTCYLDILTINDIVYTSYKDACFSLGLLDDDREYINAIIEAINRASGGYLKTLFVTMIVSESLIKPEVVWEDTKHLLTEGSS